jgi:hypothetical protein
MNPEHDTLLGRELRLARAVQVAQTSHGIQISNAVGTLTLPAEFAEQEPAFRQLLGGSPLVVQRQTSEALRHVLHAMSQQGCFRFDCPSQVSRRQLVELFEAFANRWYALYYQHPLWERLKSGQAPRPALVAWVLHNYHVSRSAGATDARCASAAHAQAVRTRFADNAIDEYAHCDDYFLVRHPGLAIPDADVKAAVPVPGSLAFDQNMLRLAERDWTAHSLVSLFQERSIQFYESIVDFYRRVESAYALPGYFDTWVAHMDLDRGEAHAERLGRFLDDDRELERAEAQEVAFGAATTFYFLLSAVGQLERATDDAPLLRRPVERGVISGRQSALCYGLFGASEHRLEHRDAARIAAEVAGWSAQVPAPTLSPGDRAFVRTSIAQLAFKALSYCRDHDAVMAWGFLAEVHRDCFKETDASLCYFGQRPGPWLAAVVNLLAEQTVQPAAAFGALLYLLRRLGADALGLAPHVVISLGRRGESLYLEHAERDRFATSLLQLEELLRESTASDADATGLMSWLM